jgi:hypothetical protein
MKIGTQFVFKSKRGNLHHGVLTQINLKEGTFILENGEQKTKYNLYAIGRVIK